MCSVLPPPCAFNLPYPPLYLDPPPRDSRFPIRCHRQRVIKAHGARLLTARRRVSVERLRGVRQSAARVTSLTSMMAVGARRLRHNNRRCSITDKGKEKKTVGFSGCRTLNKRAFALAVVVAVAPQWSGRVLES